MIKNRLFVLPFYPIHFVRLWWFLDYFSSGWALQTDHKAFGQLRSVGSPISRCFQLTGTIHASWAPTMLSFHLSLTPHNWTDQWSKWILVTWCIVHTMGYHFDEILYKICSKCKQFYHFKPVTSGYGRLSWLKTVHQFLTFVSIWLAIKWTYETFGNINQQPGRAIKYENLETGRDILWQIAT